jgi:hypothetical protein
LVSNVVTLGFGLDDTIEMGGGEGQIFQMIFNGSTFADRGKLTNGAASIIKRECYLKAIS